MYYYPLASGYWKTFNTPFDSFWCCTGTGMEEFAKFADTIYFHDNSGIYVNLFIPSEVNWAEKGIRITQETKFPSEESTTLTINSEKPVDMALNIRVPYWAYEFNVKLNGVPQHLFAAPSEYLTMDRIWHPGDKLEVTMRMGIHHEPIPGDATLQAGMFGPLVLAGQLDGEGLTKKSIYGDYGPRGNPAPVSAINLPEGRYPRWVERVKGEPLKFQTADQEMTVNLIPLNQVMDERYVVYWKVNGKGV
jgi:uncharacterized protein